MRRTICLKKKVAEIIRGPSILNTSASELHRPRPSLLLLNGLRSLPIWTKTTPNETQVAYQEHKLQKAIQILESGVNEIRDEYQSRSVVPSDYQADTEHTLHSGQWDWRSYLQKGKVHSDFLVNYPKTTTVLEELRTQKLLFEGVPFGYCFFSTLHKHSEIQPHTAPMNFRLRIHLPLTVPTTNALQCGMRVGHQTVAWQNNRALVFDDSYLHATWNHTAHSRVLLLVDIWHPDVAESEKAEIVAMFHEAKEKGWMS